ncbi:MAG: hypothetical protein LM550_10925 [Candidatus Contendobacter sp.]|nr:hypothetical protein [Candidatus Contendobacter sp.]
MASRDTVFTRIVESEHDVLGMIAYNFYKLHKQEYCQELEIRHQRPPTPEELDLFKASVTEQQVESYRQRAVVVLQSFVDEVAGASITDELQKIESHYFQRLENHLNALCPAQLPNFWYGVAQGVVASILFVAFVGFTAFLLRALDIDVLGFAKSTGENVVPYSAPVTPTAPHQPP